MKEKIEKGIDEIEKDLAEEAKSIKPKPSFKEKFRENWNKVDEKCPNCGAVTKITRGITRQNLKRLVKPRWSLNELIITFLIIGSLLLAWAYNSETKACREWITPMINGTESSCKFICNSKCSMFHSKDTNVSWNWTNLDRNVTLNDTKHSKWPTNQTAP